MFVRVGVVIGLAWALGACHHRDGGRVAELVDGTGTVDRQPDDQSPWTAARHGDGFALGSALRTGGASHALLALTRGGRLDVGAGATVRFSRKPGRSFRLDVDTGAVELEATDEPLEVDTAFGTAHVERGGAARLVGEDGRARLEILVGDAVIEQADGRTLALAAGDRIDVELGAAVLEPVRRQAAAG